MVVSGTTATSSSNFQESLETRSYDYTITRQRQLHEAECVKNTHKNQSLTDRKPRLAKAYEPHPERGTEALETINIIDSPSIS